MGKPGSKEVVLALIAALTLLGVSIYFFLLSISLMSYQRPRVTASLLALIIGFICLSSSLSLFKTALFSRTASEKEEG
jgi:divalent metal cation (Fe/Co/Zn/Cd) transporter